MYAIRSLHWATYSNVAWCLLVEAYLFRANAAMIRRTISNLILVTWLYVRVTTVLLYCLGSWTAYLLSALEYITSKQYVDRRHIADCYASASPVVLNAAAHWLDGLLYCSRYWTFITTIGGCCLLFITISFWYNIARMSTDFLIGK